MSSILSNTAVFKERPTESHGRTKFIILCLLPVTGKSQTETKHTSGERSTYKISCYCRG